MPHRPSPVAGQVCYASGDLPCAEREFRRFLARYPNDVRRTTLLAYTLTRAGKHAEALRLYDRVEAAGLRTYDVYAHHAMSLDALGRTEDAIRYNRMALDLVPQLVDVRRNLAGQLARSGRFHEAVDLLQSFDAWRARRGETPVFSAELEQLRAPLPPEPHSGAADAMLGR